MPNYENIITPPIIQGFKSKTILIVSILSNIN